MNQELQIVSSQGNPSSTLLPLPELGICIRPGVMSDIPFMDSLQKLHTKQVGWMPTAQFEGKIRAGHVLIAESDEATERRSDEGEESCPTSSPSVAPSLRRSVATPLGYCIGNDQYFKRDDVGIIYQMNVLPGKQRGLIGASLLKAQFERSAWGCKLYCCWCAQDIAANRFWEAMGFIPLAYRAGSRTKGEKSADGERGPRVHIFWQRRIRAGDETTPYWYPAQTSAGSIREDRLVLPIPPGMHWSDAKPVVLPSAESSVSSGQLSVEEKKMIAGPRVRAKKTAPTEAPRSIAAIGGLRCGPTAPVVPAKIAKLKEKRAKVKNDPKMIAAARELRDRYLDEVNSGRLLPGGTTADAGKYDVGRALTDSRAITDLTPAPLAPQAKLADLRSKQRKAA